MRILDLGEFYSERGGGVRSYLTKLAQAGAPDGHEIVIVAPGPKDEETRDGRARVIRYAAPPMPYDPTYHVPFRIDRMRSIVREVQPEVLQVSSPFVPAMVARALDAPLRTYVFHSDPTGCYLQPLARRFLSPALAQAALAPAHAWLRWVTSGFDLTVTAGHWLTFRLRELGCANAVTVPFGIDHGFFSPARRDDALRRRLLGRFADDPDAKLLLIAGRLAVDKRQRLLVRAIAKLAEKRKIALVVLGDGPERARMEDDARCLPQATFMSFAHDRNEYAGILASVDALVHGSLCETFGFVIAESMLSGTPVVVPDEGGAPALVEPGCAEIYPARADATRIALAIDRLLERPRASTSRAAQAAATRHPSSQEHFQALFTLYQRELSARGHRTSGPSRRSEEVPPAGAHASARGNEHGSQVQR